MKKIIFATVLFFAACEDDGIINDQWGGDGITEIPCEEYGMEMFDLKCVEAGVSAHYYKCDYGFSGTPVIHKLTCPCDGKCGIYQLKHYDENYNWVKYDVTDCLYDTSSEYYLTGSCGD